MSESENLGLDWNGVDAGPLHLGEGEGKGPILSLYSIPSLPMPLAQGGRFAYNRFVPFLG
jgi:hypothetical protein